MFGDGSDGLLAAVPGLSGTVHSSTEAGRGHGGRSAGSVSWDTFIKIQLTCENGD